MVEWSIAALRAAPSVASIVVAAPPGRAHGVEGPDLSVVDGGAARSDSVARALAAVETDLVAVHDAARPLLSPALVESLLDLLLAEPEAAGAIAAAPVTDTIKQVAAEGDTSSAPPATRRQLNTQEVANRRLVVGSTLERARLWAAQTPQVFRVEALRSALADPERRAAATDEASLVEAAGGRVLIHPAPPENVKITTQLDLRLAELLLAERERAAGRAGAS
jgi:2-C-methyl-D-erythritol 4-phosphate cytidylyltransferase